MVFGRKKTLQDELASGLHDKGPGAKNRPTPRRRDQEAARKRPLVVSDRKAASKTDRVKRNEAMARQRQAMVTGDDRYLPARDRGPERRYIRDRIDVRWNVGEFLLPVMLLVLLLSFTRQDWTVMVMYIGVYGLFAVAALDTFLAWRSIKKGLVAKFGIAGVPRGGAMYAAMRAFQMRFSRMPKPQVARGASLT